MFYDFDEIKRRVSFERATTLLNLKLKKSGAQFRGPCPVCASGGDRALVITESKGWYCFSARTGGDVIALVAHIRGCSIKEAAGFLSGNAAQATVPDTIPEEKEGTKTLQPLTYLESAHDAVVAIGFDPEKAKALGIGYAAKGLMRGTVAVPIRDEHGTLLGYIGIEDCRLPPDFMTNVVSLDKRRA